MSKPATIAAVSEVEAILTSYEGMMAQDPQPYDGNDLNMIVVSMTDNLPGCAYKFDAATKVGTIEATDNGVARVIATITPVNVEEAEPKKFTGTLSLLPTTVNMANWACQRLYKYCAKGGAARSSGGTKNLNNQIREQFKLLAKTATERLNAVAAL